MQPAALFGLIGYPLEHSFSKDYFSNKFQSQNIDAAYELFPLKSIDELPGLLKNHSSLEGLNVTIPYKQRVIPYLQELDAAAEEIGAVNTIVIGSKLKGYNTDYLGFKESVEPLLKPRHNKALILGTGGAAKAVEYAFGLLGIETTSISRSAVRGIPYRQLTPEVVKGHTVIVNATPAGMYPETDDCPLIPYEAITEHHLLYDLIYNPKDTLFLRKGRARAATTKNGLEMLRLQAEESWKIWRNNQN